MALITPAQARDTLVFLHTADGGPPGPGYRDPVLVYKTPDPSPEDAPLQVAAVHSLAAFIDYMWPVIHAGRPFKRGPHVDVLAFALEQLAYGRVEGDELVIAIPPRMLKSVIVNIMFPAWVWLHAPWVTIMGISGSENVAFRDNRKMRSLVTSARYKALQQVAIAVLGGYGLGPGEEWDLVKGQNQKQRFENDFGGQRFALASGAKITGEGTDLQIIDDPIDAKEALEGSQDQIADRMGTVIDRYDGVWMTRMQDPGKSPRVTIMQRLHEGDLAGHLLARGAASVVLPMEYDPAHPDLCVFDWRTETGEILLPDHYSQKTLDKMKDPEQGLGPYIYAAQFQQRPSPAKGGRFDEDNWSYYNTAPMQVMLEGIEQGGVAFSSWDCASKTKARNAATVGLFLLYLRGDLYVIDCFRDRVELPGLEAMFAEARAKYPRVRRHLVEEASNGLALIQLHPNDRTIVPIIPQGSGSKEERAGYTQRLQNAGRVHLPAGRPFSNQIKREHALFPNANLKDTVDALSQACMWLAQRDGKTTTASQMEEKLAWMRALVDG